MTEPIRMILDVDTGIDDAMAIALAVRSPAIDLVAVTTVAGNVSLASTTENTRCVLALLDASDVPVHRGFSRPLTRPLHEARHVHGERGLGRLELPPSPVAPRKPSAPETIVDTVMASPGEIVVVCVGPLTNLAVALALEPALPGALRRVVVMGGALGIVGRRGNVTPHAEFNIFVDPEAAAQVFAACPLTLVGLDVTERTNLSRVDWEGLAGREEPEARLVHDVSADRFAGGLDDVHLHDPLAVGVAIDPSLCAARRGFLTVETGVVETVGRVTLAEREDGPHLACTDVDAPRFLKRFFGTLGL